MNAGIWYYDNDYHNTRCVDHIYGKFQLEPITQQILT